MLVCNVSLRPPRSAIAADLTEAAAALDDLGSDSGQVVFATLVDDPASVNEIVDAYLGEIMLEAASADTVLDANIPATYAAAVVEAVTASDTLTSALAVVAATWDAATVTAVTLSGGNLVATNTGTSSQNQGAMVAAASGKTSGKYYFEVTTTNVVGGFGNSIGIGTTASTYTGMGSGIGVVGGVTLVSNGNIHANAVNSGKTVSGFTNGLVAGIAVDLDNRMIWFRNSGVGFWNSTSSAAADPATNTGGIAIPSGTMVPFVTFGGFTGAAGNVATANFGASAFSGAVPSGFTPGWLV